MTSGNPAAIPQRLWRLSFAFLLLVSLLPSAAQAQVRDTLRRLPTDSARQDTVRPPPPRFVKLGRLDSTNWAVGVRTWTRQELRASDASSLLQLLARIPGIITFQSGFALQPEAASSFGGLAGRIEIERDGFLLDPLDASVFDLSRIPLISLDEVVVDRRTDVLRIRLRTAEPEDARPYSRVEAGLGRPDLNVFRGLFLGPKVVFGPLALAVERVDTNGELGRQPADVFAGWMKWGIQSEQRGVQLEATSSATDREPNSPWPTKHNRRELVLRVRNQFRPGVAAEAYAASVVVKEESLIPRDPADTTPEIPFERGMRQFGVRAALDQSFLQLEGAARVRAGSLSPRFQGDASAAIDLPNRVQIRGAVTHSSGWPHDVSATNLSVRAVAGPVMGLRGFLEASTGERAAPVFPHHGAFGEPRPVNTDARSLRVGGDVRIGPLSGGAAFLDLRTDSVGAFNLPFDSAYAYFPGGAVRGWEAYARIGFFGDRLAAWIAHVNWLSGTRWAYLPARHWKAGLALHWLPLASGNLELIGSLEADGRGPVSVPAFPRDTLVLLTPLPARNVINGDLTIRIIDVHIFARYEDWAAQGVEDLPGRPIRGPRFFYGVKWFFFN